MKTISKVLLSLCTAFALCAPSFGVASLMGNSVSSVTASADDSEEDNTLPSTRPTADCGVSTVTSYTVPVYIYAKLNSTGEDASMANMAIDHSAKLVIARVNGEKEYNITLNFHPIKRSDLIGHIQKFYYYDANGTKTEVTGDSIVTSYDDLDDDDETTYAEYISQVTFELPSTSSDVTCRFKVDAMEDVEQDAVLVFDWANIQYNSALYFAERIEYAKSISNDGGTYTDESYAALQSAISTAEDALERYATQPSRLKSSTRKLDQAILSLVVNDSILSNGIYTIPIDFKVAELTTYKDAYSTYEAGETSSTDLTAIFGSTAQLTAEDGTYTLKLTAQADAQNYYLLNLIKSSYSAASLSFSGKWSEATCTNGTTVDAILTGDYIQSSFNNLYTANGMMVQVQVYDKETGTSSYLSDIIALDLDWDNMTFVENLPLDKTTLSSTVGYASSRLSGDMSAYTTDSVANYQKAYEDAKAVNEDDTVSQATVDAAVESLNDAAKALEQKVSLSGYTAELSDSVALNYFLNISDEIKDQDPTVTFTYGDGLTQEFALADASYVDGQGYKFTVKLDPKQMADTVTATVSVGGVQVPTTANTTKKLSTSVKAYAETIIANASSTYSEEAIAAAKAMLNYGGYTQVLFDYNTSSLANASLDSTDVSSVTVDSLAKYAPVKNGTDASMKFKGYNLYLDSQTRMRFYYTGDGEVSTTAENYTLGSNGDGKYIEIYGITPANLTNGYTVTIGGMEIQASPASYAHTALSKSSNEALQNAMKAMVLYSQAAAAYDAANATA